MELNSVRESLVPTGNVLEGKDCQEGPRGCTFSLDSQLGHNVASDPEISPPSRPRWERFCSNPSRISSILRWVAPSLPGVQTEDQSVWLGRAMQSYSFMSHLCPVD